MARIIKAYKTPRASGTVLDLLLYPSCCATLQPNCWFRYDVLKEMPNGSFIFICPICRKPYPASNELFKGVRYLMSEISLINKRFRYEISERSKFGMEIQSPFEGYCLAAGLYDRALKEYIGLNVWLSMSEEDKFALFHGEKSFGDSMNPGFLSQVITLSIEAFKVIDALSVASGISVNCHCRTCGNDAPLNRLSSVRPDFIECPVCHKSQRLPASALRQLLHRVERFKAIIEENIKGGLYVFPFVVLQIILTDAV